MRTAIVCAWVAIGCTGTGSLELSLSLPTTPDLRPTGMSTVTVLATSPDMDPVANTSVLTGGHTSAGDLPIGDNVQIDVLLRDVSSRLVGVGEAPQLVDIQGSGQTDLTIPVRRPFVYVADNTNLYTFDPTLDPRDGKFQGQLSGLTGPRIAVSVGGERLVVAGAMQLQIVDTATHAVKGSPIALPAMVSDVAPVPGTHQVAIAHASGISIVDIDTQQVQTAMVGPVDRVTVGPQADGKMVAYGLVGRVMPPATPLAACTGTSSLVAVLVDAPAMHAPKPLPQAVSGIAAAPATPGVFMTEPCIGQIGKLSGDPTAEISTLTLDKFSDLENAAAIAVLDERIWSAGSHASTTVCEPGGAGCSPGTAFSCPEPSGPHLAYVTDGARLVVQSIPLAGGAPVTLELPERRETMTDDSDPAHQHAQVLHSLGILPLDIVAQPGGQYVSVVTASQYYIESLTDSFTGEKILPCLQATTGDWMLLDLASSSVAQRVRTQCQLTVGPSTMFPGWSCGAPPEGEDTMQGMYMPTSIGALFGSAMTRAALALAAVLAIAPRAGADPDPKRKVAVLEYRASSSAMQGISGRVVAALRSQTSFDVLGPDQARAVFGEHLEQVIVKCAGEAECVARIGIRVGAAEVILIGVGELGDVILTMQRIDVASHAVSARVADSLAAGASPNDAQIAGYLTRLLPPSDFVRFGVIDIIASEAGAAVTVGGESRGVTPLPPIKLHAPASYEIKVEKSGFVAFSAQVAVPPDAEIKVRASLQRPGGHVAWYQHWYVLSAAGLVVAGAAGTAIYFATINSSDRVQVGITIP